MLIGLFEPYSRRSIFWQSTGALDPPVGRNRYAQIAGMNDYKAQVVAFPSLSYMLQDIAPQEPLGGRQVPGGNGFLCSQNAINLELDRSNFPNPVFGHRAGDDTILSDGCPRLAFAFHARRLAARRLAFHTDLGDQAICID